MKKDGKFRNGKNFAISKQKIPQHCTHARVSHQLCSGTDLQMSDKEKIEGYIKSFTAELP